MSDKDAYRLRGHELGMIFQEPLTRLNPLMRISDHFEETIKQHEPRISKEEVRERMLRGAPADGDPADPLQVVPARVLAAACASG